jgi:beta-lactamase regulating signal transducer with metallopeptidase domain
MPIPIQDLRAFAEIASEGILNSLLAGIAIALLAWAIALLFSRHGSGTRFAVWFSALVAIAVVPWVGHFGLGRGYPVSGISRGAVTLPASFASYLFAGWAIGATFGLLRVGLGLSRLRQLRSTFTAIELGQLSSTLRARLAEIQAHRCVTLCSSDAVRVPAAMGYFRPIVVFPAWALQEIPAAELEAILLHELAHLRRWDDWTNLAQKVVKAIFFFHPAVWFIESRLSIEREMACDDAVLASNFSPRAYAESLLGLAEKSFLRRGVQLAQAAVGHIQQLKARIVEILRSDRQGSGRVWKPAVALMAVAGIVSTYSVSRGPHLFAFSNSEAQRSSALANANSNALPTDHQLQPVNLAYVDQSRHSNAVIHLASTTRVRVTRRRPQHVVGDEITAPPMMVLSSLMESQNNATPSAVLVVMQGQQFCADGPIFWRLTVVHLTPAQQRILSGGVPKQT